MTVAKLIEPSDWNQIAYDHAVRCLETQIALARLIQKYDRAFVRRSKVTLKIRLARKGRA